MSDAQAFRFKPALLRSAQDWVLDGHELRAPFERFNLNRVTETQISEMGMKKGGVIRRFDLITADGKLSIGVTGMTSDSNVQTHADLTGAILARLAERDEALPLIIGERGVPRVSMFLAALFSLLTAMGLGIAIAAFGGRGSVESAVALAALAIFGLILCFRYWPWRVLPQVTVGVGPALVAALKG